MADISDVIRADGGHILCWQARLGQLRRCAGPTSGPELASTWGTVTALIELHARAEEEICDPAIYRAQPHGRSLAGQARDARRDICEILDETGLQPPGSPRWWQLATTALAAWALHVDDEEHGASAGYRCRADRGLREHLARQWRAFTEAVIRDQSYPGVSPHLPTCQLRLTRPATPRLAYPAFGPLACTCQTCTDQLDQLCVRSDRMTRLGDSAAGRPSAPTVHPAGSGFLATGSGRSPAARRTGPGNLGGMGLGLPVMGSPP